MQEFFCGEINKVDSGFYKKISESALYPEDKTCEASCVITKDYSLGIKIANRLECGGAIVNGASFYRSFEMPFGGWKHSGIGNEGVMTTLQEMSRLKTIILKNIL